MPLLHPLAAAHIYELIAMALGATLNGASIASCRAIGAARLKAIKADILENIGDELTVTAVALRQGITTRYMHMLFEIEGVTFSEYVLGQRLMRAYGMISDPRFADLNITTVAYASGFGDLSYFNRTFRRCFGTTPSELRKMRGLLLTALAYFMRFDLIPDMTPALGLTDDSALLVAVIDRVSSHITSVHRAAAARALGKQLPPNG